MGDGVSLHYVLHMDLWRERNQICFVRREDAVCKLRSLMLRMLSLWLNGVWPQSSILFIKFIEKYVVG